MPGRARVVVIGGTGYGGAEMIRRVLFHPNLELVRVTAADHVGERVGEVQGNLRGLTDLRFEQIPAREAVAGADVALLAMPHRVTAKVAKDLFSMERDRLTIVDMSGDFRLTNAGAYERYYGEAHAAPEALGTFVYGLPELNRDKIRGARRISSPGCFATAIELGLLPLARAGLLGGRVRTVGVTGSSGSGANPTIGTHHPLRAANLRTYKPLLHQHTPEILETLAAAGGRDLALEFVPVSAPLVRGIFATSFAEVAADVDETRVAKAFRDAYAKEPFVRVVEDRPPEVVSVAGSNYVEVGWKLAPPVGATRTVACFSTLDNLVKGGGGQAIQSLNIAMGFDETASLREPGLWP